MKNDLAASEFKDIIIDRAKSQQEVDTQIDRLADGLERKFWRNSRVRKSRVSRRLGIGRNGARRKPCKYGSATNYKSSNEKRSKKATPSDVELGLGGKFHMGNMPKSRLGGGKEDRTISAGHFKHQEDLEMYGQLPDYGEFQGCDLGMDSRN